MNPRQKLLAILISALLLILIVEMVRRRKLREEYSFLWLIAGVSVLLLGAWQDLLRLIARFFGIAAPESALFLLGFIFIVLINLHFSLKISELTNKLKVLTQDIVLLKEVIERNQCSNKDMKL